jgi:hypothetical protein
MQSHRSQRVICHRAPGAPAAVAALSERTAAAMGAPFETAAKLRG